MLFEVNGPPASKPYVLGDQSPREKRSVNPEDVLSSIQDYNEASKSSKKKKKTDDTTETGSNSTNTTENEFAEKWTMPTEQPYKKPLPAVTLAYNTTQLSFTSKTVDGLSAGTVYYVWVSVSCDFLIGISEKFMSTVS